MSKVGGVIGIVIVYRGVGGLPKKERALRCTLRDDEGNVIKCKGFT